MGKLNYLDIRDERTAELTLRDILMPLFRHRRLMALSFLGVFLGGVLAALLLANQYQAHFRVLVKRERVDPVVSSEASSQTIQPAPAVTEEEINSEVELIQSDDLLRRVVLATGLQKKEDHSAFAFLRPRKSEETLVSGAVRRLARQLRVGAVRKTNLIEVSYQTTDPQLANRVLTTLASFYLEKHLAVHRPPGALDFFQQETEQYRNNLTTAKLRLGNFITRNKVANAVGERDLMLQGLSRFDATLRDTETGIAETHRRIGDLEAQLKVTPPRLSTAHRASDNAGVLQILESTLATLELKRSDMMAHYNPEYRPLQDLENQVVQARAQVRAAKSVQLQEDTTDANPAYLWLTEELVKSRADLATFKARASASARNIQLYRQGALDLGQKDLEQEDLIRNAKAEEDNFLLYLKKREEARISDALDSKRILNVAISEPSTVPALPAHSPWLFVLLGTLLATIVSMGAAFVSDYIDPTLRTADEARNLMGIPVLAALPKIQRA